jgi:hypothetical protein
VDDLLVQLDKCKEMEGDGQNGDGIKCNFG